jgi:hypothetical protein
MKRSRLAVVLLLVALFLVAGQVYAYNYSLLVPSFGRSATTSMANKTGNCTSPLNYTSSVSSNFTLHGVPKNSSGQDVSTSQWVSAGTYNLYAETKNGPCTAGTSRYMNFATQATTTFDLNISGDWLPG